jgi:2-polyprenyl-3-methyl-5-hydroxy-6-metoxy-1,4-benzoquinol methylase
MAAKPLNEHHYDQLYLNDDRTYERPHTSPYYGLYSKIVELVRQESLGSVLEVGCGSGVLAEMLIGSGVRYQGFDFSPVAIQKALQRNPEGKFSVGDATDPAAYQLTYDGVVCSEVLEHIEEDLTAIRCWKSGTVAICSVPNFDYESHVRFFSSEEEIVQRYGALLDIFRIERVAKSAWANLTLAEYFRRIRWERGSPRRVLGILGVKAFAWYGGWFVFAGRRR